MQMSINISPGDITVVRAELGDFCKYKIYIGHPRVFLGTEKIYHFGKGWIEEIRRVLDARVFKVWSSQ